MNSLHPLGDPGELAALYTAGALNSAEQAEFEQHLAKGCPACTAALSELTPVATALAECVAPVVPPADVRAKLMQRITKSGDQPARQVWKRWQSDASPGLTILRADQGAWEDTGVPGVRVKRLSVDHENDRFTALVRMDPGSAYPRHIHRGAEECLVLEGELFVGEEAMHAGDYQRAAEGSQHVVQSTRTGCLLLIVSSLSDELID